MVYPSLMPLMYHKAEVGVALANHREDWGFYEKLFE